MLQKRSSRHCMREAGAPRRSGCGVVPGLLTGLRHFQGTRGLTPSPGATYQERAAPRPAQTPLTRKGQIAPPPAPPTRKKRSTPNPGSHLPGKSHPRPLGATSIERAGKTPGPGSFTRKSHSDAAATSLTRKGKLAPSEKLSMTHPSKPCMRSPAHGTRSARPAGRTTSGAGHPENVQGCVQLFLGQGAVGDVASFDDHFLDRAAGGQRLLGDLGGLVIAQEAVEWRHDRR